MDEISEGLAGPYENRHNLGVQDMRMMREAIDGVRDFRAMMDKIEAAAAQQQDMLRMQSAMQGTPDERH